MRHRIISYLLLAIMTVGLPMSALAASADSVEAEAVAVTTEAEEEAAPTGAEENAAPAGAEDAATPVEGDDGTTTAINPETETGVTMAPASETEEIVVPTEVEESGDLQISKEDTEDFILNEDATVSEVDEAAANDEKGDSRDVFIIDDPVFPVIFEGSYITKDGVRYYSGYCTTKMIKIVK